MVVCGLPNFMPFAFAFIIPDFILAVIISRSNSAKTPHINIIPLLIASNSFPKSNQTKKEVCDNVLMSLRKKKYFLMKNCRRQRMYFIQLLKDMCLWPHQTKRNKIVSSIEHIHEHIFIKLYLYYQPIILIGFQLSIFHPSTSFTQTPLTNPLSHHPIRSICRILC